MIPFVLSSAKPFPDHVCPSLFFDQALQCATTEDEALATGLTLDELRSRSFVKIMKERREAG